jgi:hypothetical protein
MGSIRAAKAERAATGKEAGGRAGKRTARQKWREAAGKNADGRLRDTAGLWVRFCWLAPDTGSQYRKNPVHIHNYAPRSSNASGDAATATLMTLAPAGVAGGKLRGAVRGGGAALRGAAVSAGGERAVLCAPACAARGGEPPVHF